MTTTDDQSRAPHRDFAGRVALATLVVLGILALVAVVWVGRLIVALLFFAIVNAILKSEVRGRQGLVMLRFALFNSCVALAIGRALESE